MQTISINSGNFGDALDRMGNFCQAEGCRKSVGYGLALRFCAECRPKQPIPTDNHKRAWRNR